MPATFQHSDRESAGLRPAARRLKQRVFREASVAVRRAYYVDRRRWPRILARSKTLGARLQLLDATAVGSRRIELGGGSFPTPGFIHVDGDWRGLHLEAVSTVDALPFSDGFANEILAIHLLEHVHPTQLCATLTEWRRVLRHGGLLQIHVPDGPALFERYQSASPEDKWRYVSALLGMYSAPEIRAPSAIATPADHQVIFDWPLLRSVLAEAGYADITNVSDAVRDRHTVGWEPFLGQISLIVRAYRPDR